MTSKVTSVLNSLIAQNNEKRNRFECFSSTINVILNTFNHVEDILDVFNKCHCIFTEQFVPCVDVIKVFAVTIPGFLVL